MAKEVRDYEPKLALVGGEAGTEIIQRLLAQSVERLRPGGWLIFEISPMILDSVRQLIDAEPRLRFVTLVKDLAGYPRVITVQRTAY